jgi:hypothetical protein
MFLITESSGDALTGLILMFLRLYPNSDFKGTLLMFLRVKLLGIGFLLICNLIGLLHTNASEWGYSIP